ncbi:ABC transporter ATP-binding protein [uncultured Victivallis sp.]|uniref:ABC transporter ATP-binding protein n=1 Tax=uncultured Victivallis sp. TaxID=354118 RepID=UPI0025DD834C|nr:dipeptide ABC transporter ATP-binding protein [uncultured Victivallis sp.]
MALLEVEDLKVHYPVRGSWFRPKRFVRAVDGVSFSLEAGETVGLVGESGCGKSTLGRALVRLEQPVSGRVLLDGKDMAALRGRELRRARRNFQMIFQDPYGSLNPRLTVWAALDEVLALHSGLEREARQRRAVELLERVGLSAEALYRYPHQFSGGQRQRIGIARALAAEPRFIVADEPVSALDVSVQAAIINLLDDIRRETGTSFLFIAHDLAVVEHISSRILVMYLGHIVESAPSRELVASPRHPYTQALLSAVPTLDAAGRKRIVLPGDVPSPLSPPAGCPFHPRCPRAQERCRREAPPLAAVPGSARKCACFYPVEGEQTA